MTLSPEHRILTHGQYLYLAISCTFTVFFSTLESFPAFVTSLYFSARARYRNSLFKDIVRTYLKKKTKSELKFKFEGRRGGGYESYLMLEEAGQPSYALELVQHPDSFLVFLVAKLSFLLSSTALTRHISFSSWRLNLQDQPSSISPSSSTRSNTPSSRSSPSYSSPSSSSIFLSRSTRSNTPSSRFSIVLGMDFFFLQIKWIKTSS